MVTKTDNTSYLTSSVYLTRNLWSGILFGLGLVAFIDETIFINCCIGTISMINLQQILDSFQMVFSCF